MYLDCGCHFFGFAVDLKLETLAVGISLFIATAGLEEACIGVSFNGSSSVPSS